MSYVDKAIIEWANDQLAARGYPRDATGIRFGYDISCWSSWTHDYGVTAEIVREDGSLVDTDRVWSAVLEALPAYVAAQEAMHDEHNAMHNATHRPNSFYSPEFLVTF